MARGLAVSDIVNVTVTLSPIAAGYRNFGATLILGSSPGIIDVAERIRSYSNLSGVASDFGTTAPEYQAATLFFEQSPQPNLLYIGRWAQSATHGHLHGGLLNTSAQLLSNFTAVTSGAFFIKIDGVPYTVSGLNFSGASNLNGVASTIQTALSALAAGAVVQWNSNYTRFEVDSGTAGPASAVSYAQAPTAFGNFAFTGQPAANDTISIGGTTVTFVSASPTGNQVLIGASLAATLTNLVTFLGASADVNIVKALYSVVGTTLYVVYATTGAAGNSFTLAKSSTNITVSGSTLLGGTGTDCSATLGLTSASNGSSLVAGIAAESLASCVSTLCDMSSSWYALTVATTTAPSTADHTAVGSIIEAQGWSRIYAITSSDSNILSALSTSDVASQVQALNLSRTLTQYCSSNPYASASLLGRIATVNYEGNSTALTVKFKTEPGIVAEQINESQEAALKAKNCNIFVLYNNNTAILQEGVMANGYFIDERQGLDWLQNRIQNDVWNVLYQSQTKIPQTDAGTNILVNAINNSLAQAVANGLCAPGVWNANGFGQLAQGQYLPSGYYVYAPPVATQAQADREARKSVPIQVALKGAGAIHFANVAVSFNR